MKNIIKYLLVLLVVAGISTGGDNFLTPSVDQNKPTETATQSVADVEHTVSGTDDERNNVDLYGRDDTVSQEVQGANAFSNGNSGRFDSETEALTYAVNSGYAQGVWRYFYQAITGANLAIHAELDATASAAAVDHWKGQAHAVRAFSHLNLLMAFGQQYVDGSDLGVP